MDDAPGRAAAREPEPSSYEYYSWMAEFFGHIRNYEANTIDTVRLAITGKMHACGHDGHMTMLFGAARYLPDHRDSFVGQVVFIFQPAEDVLTGARRMIVVNIGSASESSRLRFCNLAK